MKLLGEWWAQMWPNLASSGVTFGSGLVWARRRLLRELERRELAHLRRHDELRKLIKGHAAVSDVGCADSPACGTVTAATDTERSTP